MAFQESYRDLMYGDWMADEKGISTRLRALLQKAQNS